MQVSPDGQDPQTLVVRGTDAAGVIELRISPETTSLTAWNNDGEVIASGPYDSSDDQQSLSENLRARADHFLKEYYGASDRVELDSQPDPDNPGLVLVKGTDAAGVIELVISPEAGVSLTARNNRGELVHSGPFLAAGEIPPMPDDLVARAGHFLHQYNLVRSLERRGGAMPGPGVRVGIAGPGVPGGERVQFIPGASAERISLRGATDSAGSVSIETYESGQFAEVVDPDGNVQFSGPIDTPEQLAAIADPTVRSRIERALARQRGGPPQSVR